MIALALLLQATSGTTAPPPSVPPPPADSLAAATLLWADHPPSADAKRMAIDDAVASATSEALYRVGIQPTHHYSVTGRYLVKYDQLRPLVARNVTKDSAALDHAVAECAVEQIARALLPQELATVRLFMSGPTGRKFWDAAALTNWPLARCYRSALDLSVSDAEYRLVGLKPPKPPKPPRRGTMFAD